MYLYLEALEQSVIDQPSEFVRLDVTDKTETEQADILTALKNYMVGISCTFQKHYCRYEDNDNNPCTTEEKI